MWRLSVICMPFILSCATAFADGVEHGDARPGPTLPQASTASFDKRLPPVLPGEEVGSGSNRMKVWSSTGAVPVAQPPEPWQDSAGSRRVQENVGIVVREDPPAEPSAGEQGR